MLARKRLFIWTPISLGSCSCWLISTMSATLPTAQLLPSLLYEQASYCVGVSWLHWTPHPTLYTATFHLNWNHHVVWIWFRQGLCHLSSSWHTTEELQRIVNAVFQEGKYWGWYATTKSTDPITALRAATLTHAQTDQKWLNMIVENIPRENGAPSSWIW